MPITDKLNSIITKLSDGATKPTGQTIEEKLDIIDSLIDAGGGSGGSGSLLITVTIQYDNDTETYLCTADKTFEEIASAIDNGIIPMVVTDSEPRAYYQLSLYAEDSVEFSKYLRTSRNDGIIIDGVTFNNDGVIDYYIYTFYGATEAESQNF